MEYCGESHLMNPVAISGIACRLPGGVNNPSDLWQLLIEGRSGQGEIPPSRFSKDAFHHEDPEHAGCINGTGGYFLQHDIRSFDNNFFGIHNLEAKYMDPQQRQLLEVVYECLENAGESLESVSGANIGCYVANFTIDHAIMQARDPDLYHRYSATGFGPTILANRLSHLFNLKGPSFVLDTACSSSLYAVHTACAALNAGDCDAAIVAGANLIQSPEVFVAMAKAGVLSSTSTSHTFDATADGYGRGEGVAALFLRRLDHAIRNQDPVRSVIRGTAVNSNGHTSGITLPGVLGQEAVIRKAYAAAQLDMNDTVYVEAHGTGTPVGDPIEVHALSNAFSTHSRHTLLIGSNKPNVGHGEAVSGLTSIIKATLALEKRLIPPTRGISNISSDLKLSERNINIVQSPLQWPEDRVERISVNAFGYGGANAHTIIDSAAIHMTERCSDQATVEPRSVLLPMSASHPDSLQRNLDSIANLELFPHELQDLAYTLTDRRSAFMYKDFMLGTLTESGIKFSRGSTSVSDSSNKPLAFIFTGQGAQWPGMGKELMNRFPTFESVIADLDAHLRTLAHAPSWTIKETLLESPEVGSIYIADRSQTVCTALQVALVVLLQEWGAGPAAVVGHSSGEIGAAFAAGHISSHEALAIAYYRGYVSGKIPTKGAMLAAGIGAEETIKIISSMGLQEVAGIACVNSPASTTISGETAPVEAIMKTLEDRQIFVRKLKTDGRAYHSHLMRIAGEEYERLLSTALSPTPSTPIESAVRMSSSVTADFIYRDEIREPAYWRRNLESPVLFKHALEMMVKDESYHFIEVGPHPALGQPVRDTLNAIPGEELLYSSSLYRGKSDEICMLNLAGRLFLAGKVLNIAHINGTATSEQFETRSNFSSGELSSRSEAQDSGIEDMSDRGGSPRISQGKTFVAEELTSTLKVPQPVIFHHRLSAMSTQNQPRVFQRLPPYAWHHDIPLWAESQQSQQFRDTKYMKHDLLGSRVPGVPGTLAIWRNQLKLSQVPWVADHRLGSTIVFPAAGYLAMAIEALLQIKDRPSTGTVVLRQVHLMNMLVPPAAERESIEVSTVLEEDQISQTTNSSLWWRFKISSFASGSTTVHANGLIGLRDNGEVSSTLEFPHDLCLEEQATRTMYNRLAAQGLCFGPQFKSMKAVWTDRHRQLAFASAGVEFRSGGKSEVGVESSYVIHPITIDSLLQSAIVASCKGASEDLYGKVPVEVGSLEITLQDPPPASQLCSIRAGSVPVGFDAVLLSGELQNATGRTLANMRNVRAIKYRETSLTPKTTLQRNPALRILWKPDISTLVHSTSRVLADYAQQFQQYLPHEWEVKDQYARIGAMLDLLSHKDGRMDILEIGTEDNTDFTDFIYKLSLSQAPREFASYTRASIDQNGCVNAHSTGEKILAAYPLIIVPSTGCLEQQQLEQLSRFVAPNGSLLLAETENRKVNFDSTIFSTVQVTGRELVNWVTLARKSQTIEQKFHIAEPVLLVHDGTCASLIAAIEAQIIVSYQTQPQILHVAELNAETIRQDSIIISTLEYTTPILSTLTATQQTALSLLAESASILLWVTGGNLFKSSDPECATILGLARTLMLERPSLKMPVLDLEKSGSTPTTASEHIVTILNECMSSPNPDFEFREHQSTLHISRFIPDASQNRAFRDTQDSAEVRMRIGDVGYAKLGMRSVGQLDTLRFEQTAQSAQVEPGFVRVKVQAVGMNAKDLYAMSDRINISGSTCGLEFSGVIIETGSANATLKKGDRVVVMAPHHYATIEDVPEWACCKLREGEDAIAMATVPLVFSTALYALEQRARLEEGQSVLIHSGAGGLGLAAIQVSQMLGADVFTTVGTTDKRKFLTENFEIPDDHIFDSHSPSFAKDLLDATGGRGVDVILNSLTGDMLHQSWETLAPFGTFVEVGKRDIADSGKLNLRMFERSVTFTAFDLTDIFWAKPHPKRFVWSRLLQRSVSLIRSGHVKLISPLKVFPASEIVSAFRYFSSGTRMGKVVVSFEENREISIVPFKHRTKFDADKSYLLVGCLGGLGRSISRWMLQLGAKHFTFIGRSGTDKPSAARLVADLEASGATVTVCKGSVADRSVVDNAVGSSTRPIGGVIQASMAIHVSLFKDMSNSTWHAGINQKIRGTWNLHHALTGRDEQLDFFLMLSSITGSVGTATESNYCAANSFLDAFGSYRRSLGLPAVAVGLGMISEVGFLHENPETEAVLLRKGVHPFTEAELLQIIDISLNSLPPDSSAAVDEGFGNKHEVGGHILTGLELHGFQKIRDQGFVRGTKVLEDPRCTYIAGAFAENTDSADASDSKDTGAKLPQAVRIALAENGESEVPGDALMQAIKATLVKSIASLLLVSQDSLEMSTLLADFGMESMLAAELRSDVYRAFNVDVAFALLLDKRTQVSTVVKVIGKCLLTDMVHG